METLTDLEKGIEILMPFLMQHHFVLNTHDNLGNADSYFTQVKFINKNKEFKIGYLTSVGYLIYKYEDLKVSHDFYLDKLGFAGKRKFKAIQTENKLLVFKNILHDFEFLVEDFFAGNCTKLREYSKHPENIIKLYDKRAEMAREMNNRQSDEIRIEQARKKFINKDFKESLELFRSLENKNLISMLDEKIIDYCTRYLDT